MVVYRNSFFQTRGPFLRVTMIQTDAQAPTFFGVNVLRLNSLQNSRPVRVIVLMAQTQNIFMVVALCCKPRTLQSQVDASRRVPCKVMVWVKRLRAVCDRQHK